MKELLVAALAVSFVFLGAGCGGSKATDDTQANDEVKSTRPRNISEMADKAGIASDGSQDQSAEPGAQ